MNKTKHIAQFESFHEDPRINDYDYVNSIICITDYNGTIAVGMVGNQRDRVYIDPIMETDAAVTKFTYESEKDFVSYDDNGDFELITEGTNYTSGSGYVFPILGIGEFLVLNYSGHGSSYELVNAMELKKLFVG